MTRAASWSPCSGRAVPWETDPLPDVSAMDLTSVAPRELPRWMFDSTKIHRTVSTGDRSRRALPHVSLIHGRGVSGPFVELSTSSRGHS